MPGPGNKKKTKPKPGARSSAGSASASATPQRSAAELAKDIEDAEGWELATNLLCNYFDLPDLSTRSGLKRVHSNFEVIYKRLDDTYTKYPQNSRLKGAVVGVLAKMCYDKVLRDKLLKKGVLSRVLPLLNDSLCLHLALRSLASMTHLGGEAKIEVAKHIPAIAAVLDAHPGDAKAAELVAVTLAHAGAVLGADDVDTRFLHGMDIAGILDKLAAAARADWATAYLVDHVLEFVTYIALPAPAALRKSQALDLVIAFIRSEDIGARCSALRVLLRVTSNESEEDRTQVDPNRLMNRVQQRMPNEIMDAIEDPMRMDILTMMATTRDFTNAMMGLAQNGNLLALAPKLAEFILRTEFSVADGMWQFQDERTGRLVAGDPAGLGFTRWMEALPACAKALRARRRAGDEEMADMLECKYFIAKQNLPRAFETAERALRRNPDLAYFHYALTLKADRHVGLRSAKRGLVCKAQLTPFVHTALLARGVEHASDLALCDLYESRPGAQKWKQGIGFLRSAFEDTKTYMKMAPLDARPMKAVVRWHILLACVVRGPAIDADMSQLKDTLHTLHIVEKLAEHYGFPLFNTQVRLAQQLLVARYTPATRAWGAVVARYDEAGAPPADGVDTDGPVPADDEFAAWLARMDIGEHGEEEPVQCWHPSLGPHRTYLYRCANCGNPSAVLRKCGRCDKARYCDAECQKSHWAEHKAHCKV